MAVKGGYNGDQGGGTMAVKGYNGGQGGGTMAVPVKLHRSADGFEVVPVFFREISLDSGHRQKGGRRSRVGPWFAQKPTAALRPPEITPPPRHYVPFYFSCFLSSLTQTN
jgi:hypothetical protein